MTSLPGPISNSWDSPRKKKKSKSKSRPLYTIQAPLEVISFFYRLGREADDQKQMSGNLELPDDTPIPDPILNFYTSKTGTLDLIGSPVPNRQLSASYSVGEVTDFERMGSVSWLNDDEGTGVDGPLRIVSTRSDHRINEKISTVDEKIDSGESSKQSIFKMKSWTKPRIARANSSDFAYSEANEVSRISVSMLKSSKAIGNYWHAEKKEDNSALKTAEKQLKNGRQSIIYSKPMLNTREKRYERQKDRLTKKYAKQSSLLKAALLRAKTRIISGMHRRASTELPSIPILEELKEVDLYFYDDEHLENH